MSAASSDPVLDALVAASASLRLQSQLARPPPPAGGSGNSGGRGTALSELEGTTSPKLYGVSDDIDCSNVKICFGLIGGNSGICVRQNCSTRAHAISKFPLAGSAGRFVFIRRNVPETVFATPFLSVDKIPQGVRDDWSTKTLPLPIWTLKFQAVDITNDTFASEDSIDEETLFLSKAELIKTPAKRKRDPDDEVILGVWQGPKLERTLPSPGEDLDSFIDLGVSKEKLIQAVASVESNMLTMNDGAAELATLTHNRFTSVETNADVMMGILQALKSRVGNAIDVDERFVAPTLWGTTSIIADQVSGMKATVDYLSQEVRPMKTDLTKQIENLKYKGEGAQKGFDLMVGVVKSLIEDVQAVMVTVFDLKKAKKDFISESNPEGFPPRSQLDELIDVFGKRRSREEEEVEDKAEANDGPTSLNFKSDPQYQQLLADVRSLKSAVNDADSVKFAGLGLRDVKETIKWVDQNFPSLKYGLMHDGSTPHA